MISILFMRYQMLYNDVSFSASAVLGPITTFSLFLGPIATFLVKIFAILSPQKTASPYSFAHSGTQKQVLSINICITGFSLQSCQHE